MSEPVDYPEVLPDPDAETAHQAFLAQIAQSQAEYDEAQRQRVERQALTDALAHLSKKAHAPALNGKPWVQPLGAHDAYPADAEVTHKNKAWVSTTPFNVWEPGVSGWREKAAPGGAPAAWMQPTGAHDAYGLAAVVTHKGRTWTSTAPNNVWEPGVYGWA